MKKILVLLVVLVLSMTAAAFAESVPSKVVADLTKVEVVAENAPVDAGLAIVPVVVETVEYKEKIEACQKELVVLAQSASVAEYFGEVKTAAGEAVDLKAVLQAETLNVHEFCPFVVEKYEESYGKTTAKMQFSTPYAAGEKVVVLIGLVKVDANGNQIIEWVAYEGVGVAAEAQGCIEVEFDPEIMMAIQEGNAMLAVVSK